MPKPKPILSKEELLKIFDYKDGEIYRKPEKAGTIDGGGYVQTGIKGKYFKNHRLIFMMHFGYVPETIDHIDGNKLNNKIENLRPASKSENQYNKKFQSNNTSGVKGVTWRKDIKKWRAKITVDGKHINIGNFDNVELAEKEIKKVRLELHKCFSNNG